MDECIPCGGSGKMAFDVATTVECPACSGTGLSPDRAYARAALYPRLVEACRAATETIRAWNTMGFIEGTPEYEQVAAAYEHSPELKQLNSVLAEADKIEGEG